MIMDFIRSQEQAGRAVESVCAVLREQGLQVAARTYRAARARAAAVMLRDDRHADRDTVRRRARSVAAGTHPSTTSIGLGPAPPGRLANLRTDSP
jgi:hypothetical protein